jgi:hypothetical protein
MKKIIIAVLLLAGVLAISGCDADQIICSPDTPNAITC